MSIPEIELSDEEFLMKMHDDADKFTPEEIEAVRQASAELKTYARDMPTVVWWCGRALDVMGLYAIAKEFW